LFIELRHVDGDGVEDGAFSGGVEGGDDFPLAGWDVFIVAALGDLCETSGVAKL